MFLQSKTIFPHPMYMPKHFDLLRRLLDESQNLVEFLQREKAEPVIRNAQYL